ncbi:MAG TPA: response regulator transcription factor [Gaiellaceae bacterium]
MPRVLVVDDEAAQRRLLRAYLEKESLEVVEADNGLDALSLLRGGGIDVALVDVMLPGLDGFEVVRRARRETKVPIILLTARGEETSRVAGLELGADDYVVKPFSAPEVVARVRVQLRRLEGDGAAGTLRAGRAELDLDGRRLLVDGTEVELTRREFDLLAELMQHAGRALTREQLLERAWGSSYHSAKTVDVHVAGLRRKLGDAVAITALRGVGYRLEG